MSQDFNSQRFALGGVDDAMALFVPTTDTVKTAVSIEARIIGTGEP